MTAAAQSVSRLPLSFAQEQFWFLDALEPEGLFNVSLAYRLSGSLDERALTAAVDQLVERHSPLRAYFPSEDGRPYRELLPAERAPRLDIADLRHLAVEERWAEAERLAVAEGEHRFSLAEGPLFRARLLCLDDHDHLLLLTAHHSVIDGWSVGVVLSELSEVYRSELEGCSPQLPPLGGGYDDYVSRQRAHDGLDAQLAHWRKQLAGLTTLALPTDRPRPPRRSFRGAHHRFDLPRGLAEELLSLCRRCKATPYMVLLAAFQALLSRYSGQEDIVVGSPSAGRVRPELEPLVGLFVNTLVLRGDLGDDPSFEELLERTREMCLNAYVNQDVPVFQLVAELQPERDPSRSPLFQVMFQLENLPANELELPGVVSTLVEPALGVSVYDLTLGLAPAEDGSLVGTITYNRDLFESETIERLSGHYLRLLAAAATSPQTRLSELPLTSDSELLRLDGWARGQVVNGHEDRLLHEWWQEQVRQTPDRVAVSLEEAELSYRELNRRANRLARRLRASGVSCDTIVAICAERSLETVIALLAVLKAGGAYLPLDPSYPLDRLAYMLDDSGAQILLVQERFRSRLPVGENDVVLLLEDDCANEDDYDLPRHAHPDSLAYLIYTSGSTGQPKGAALPHRAIVNHMVWVLGELGLGPDDVVLQRAPFSFDASIWEFYAPLLVGGRLELAQHDLHGDPGYLVDLCAERGVTVIQTVPAVLGLLLDEPGLSRCRHLRVVLSGGDRMPLDWQARLTAALPEARLVNLWGPTEVCIDATSLRTEDWLATGTAASQPIFPLGRPIPNMEVYVLDRGLSPQPPGVPGEIYVGGVQLARGYFAQPALTAERFLPHPFSAQPGARLYRTGDRGRLLADGTLEFLGRVDHQVKIRGFRVELGELEAALTAHPAVKEAAAAVQDGPGGARLVAYVVAEDDQPTRAELDQFLAARLPSYMMPAAYVPLASLPLGPSGKLARDKLPEPAEAEAQGAQPIFGAEEEQIAAIWAELLGRGGFGAEDDFFELGGHSLLAAQLITRLRSSFEVKLRLNLIFEQPTVAGQATAVREARGEAPVPAKPPPASTEAPLSFAQERLWLVDQLQPENRYHIPLCFRLNGPLDRNALERALQGLLDRHEALRACFPREGGQPTQLIQGALAVELPVDDLSGQTTERRSRNAYCLARQEGERPFSLATGPLMRARLIRLHPEEHLFCLTFHHIVADGWSVALVLHELSALYAAALTGQDAQLSPLTSFGDHVAAERAQAAAGSLEPQLDYWRERLVGVEPLDLPLDRPRPARARFRGATRELLLSPALGERLRAVGRQEKATLFMTLLAVYQLLLARYCGQEDIVIGTPVAGRSTEESESLVGFLANTLPLRLQSGQGSFSEHLRDVRAACLDAYANQDAPLERLVAELLPERDLSRPPLFQTLFTLQEAGGRKPAFPGLTAEPVRLGYRMASFELALGVQDEGPEGLRVSLVYDRDLFRAATAAQILESFQLLLEQVADGPARPLAKLKLLTDDEQQRLLGPVAEPRRQPQDWTPIHKRFEALAKTAPDSLVVVAPDGASLSYGEVNRRADHLARRLRAQGAGPEQAVGVCLDRSPELVVAFLAALKSGAAYLPLDPALPDERLRLLAGDARVVVGDEKTLPRFSGVPVVTVTAGVDPALSFETGESAGDSVGESAAYVIYTSGSTGRPKGVVVSHNAFAASIDGHLQELEITAEDRVSLSAPIGFDVSPLQLGVAVASGASLAVVDDSGDFPPETSVLVVTPSVLATLNRGRFPRLRATVVGGELYPREQALEWAPLYNCYGATETTAITADYDDGLGKRAPLGRSITGVRLYLLDEQLQPVPEGVIGEIYVGGDDIARGYLDQPGLTAAAFIPDSFGPTPGGRLYRTGDLARRHRDGLIEFVGRRDGQVKIRGQRVEIGEAEAVLTAHPLIRAAAVTAFTGPSGRHLVGYFVAADETPAAADLRAFLAERLPLALVPAHFQQLPELPLTTSGKLDRARLPAPEIVAEDVTPPRDERERLLCSLWEDLLGREQVGIHDDFFRIGGHSLLATMLVARIREAFGCDLAVRTLFENPTVAELAVALTGVLADSERPADEGPRAVPRPERLPLSWGQQRLWFLEQVQAGLYNSALGYRLRGPLDILSLESSLLSLAARHEPLHSAFAIADGQPYLKLQRPSFPLEVIDLSELAAEARERAVKEHIDREVARPFDLSAGALARALLIEIGVEDRLLVLIVHHAAFDGQSIGILERELTLLYAAARAGEEAQLAPLPLQYADYSLWQRSREHELTVHNQLAHWRQHLQGVEPLSLPLDRPRPRERTWQGANLPIEIPALLSARLDSLAQEAGVTPFMFLLAALQALLGRLCGQDDVIVGTPIAGRPYRQLEPLIGFFANTLPLRQDLSGDPTFRELLAASRRVCLDAYANQDVPFEHLVAELTSERNASRLPLVEVMFSLSEEQPPELELGARVVHHPVVVERAHFDLSLALVREEERMTGALAYASDLFEHATAEAIVARYLTLLEQVAGDLDLRLSEIDVLLPGEREQLRAWNARSDTATSPSTTLAGLLAEQAARTPASVAVVDHGQELSYRELEARAAYLARRLTAAGVEGEMRVGVCLGRGPDLVIALLAIIKAGGVYLPLDPAYPRERLGYLLDDSGVAVVLTDQEHRARVPAGAAVLLVDEDGACSASAPRPAEHPEAGAYLIYTSGSTGQPKGVLVPQRALLTHLAWAVERYQLGPGERMLQFSSPSFDASLQQLLAPLACGATIVLSDPGREGPSELLEYIHREQVSVLNLPPAYFASLLEALPDEPLLEHVRLAVIGGDVFPVEVLPLLAARAPRLELLNAYGPTEAAVNSCLFTVPLDWDSRVPLGPPNAHTTLHVLDQDLQEVPIGVRGELYIGGLRLARGYLGRPSLTAERFLPDPFGQPGARLYRSGDLVRRRRDGTLDFLGRGDDQVQIRGIRVEPGEIEHQLRAHPALKEAAVLAQQLPRRGRQLVAYVVSAADEGPSDGELRQFLAARLPDQLLPVAYVHLPALPLSPNGKLDRSQLPLPEISGHDQAEPPRNESERQVAAVFAELLGVEDVSREANFFELGGDSLLSLRLLARLNADAIRLRPRDVFECQTVAALAARVEQSVARPVAGVAHRHAPASVGSTLFLKGLAPAMSDPAHFNLGQLLELSPDADLDRVARALEVVIDHHPSLRALPVWEGSTWRLRYDGPAPVVSRVVSEQPLADIVDSLQRGVTLEDGPLARFAVLEHERRKLLLVVCHHLLVDAYSLLLVLDDLETVYQQLTAAKVPALAPATNPGEWADHLYQLAEKPQAQADHARFEADLAHVSPLPVDAKGHNVWGSAGVVKRRLERAQTAKLREHARSEGGGLDEFVLLSLLQTVSEWSGADRVAVAEMRSGRDLLPDLDLSRTVGWLACEAEMVFARPDNIVELRRQRDSYPFRGHGAGLRRLLGHDCARPELAFNYLGSGSSRSDLIRAKLESGTLWLEPTAPRTSLLELNGRLDQGALVLEWRFSHGHHLESTVQGLADAHLLALLQAAEGEGA